MDDELPSPGLNGFTGYALGRMSAQSERALADFGKALQRPFRPAAPSVDVDALIAENQMLRQQLEATQADLSELEGIYSRLKAWGVQASKVLSQHGLLEE